MKGKMKLILRMPYKVYARIENLRVRSKSENVSELFQRALSWFELATDENGAPDSDPTEEPIFTGAKLIVLPQWSLLVLIVAAVILLLIAISVTPEYAKSPPMFLVGALWSAVVCAIYCLLRDRE